MVMKDNKLYYLKFIYNIGMPCDREVALTGTYVFPQNIFSDSEFKYHIAETTVFYL